MCASPSAVGVGASWRSLLSVVVFVGARWGVVCLDERDGGGLVADAQRDACAIARDHVGQRALDARVRAKAAPRERSAHWMDDSRRVTGHSGQQLWVIGGGGI